MTEPVEPTYVSVSRESVGAIGNQLWQQRVASPEQATCNSRRDNTKGREEGGRGGENEWGRWGKTNHVTIEVTIEVREKMVET